MLVNWPLLIETLKTTVTGQYTLSCVTAPIPLLPEHAPVTPWDWLFVLYAVGVLLCAARYAVGYLRLRHALSRRGPVTGGMREKLRETEHRYGLKACQAVTVEGIGSAFVCGLFHPVLVLPEEEVDEKVLLHELMHLKHRDVFWGLVICLFRCIHWCNPVLWYCADAAGNDLEARCDQRVLEQLEGEERRDYGRILLSMANEKYARAPGTSSLSNGGRNIRLRIEAIARFKRYPKGMGLVSAAVIVVLASALAVGVRSRSLLTTMNVAANMASARLNYCTTPGAAVDTYAKAVLTGSIGYRAVCAPIGEHASLAQEMEPGPVGLNLTNLWNWDSGNTEPLDGSRGYVAYGFEEDGTGGYRTMLVFVSEDTFDRNGEPRIKSVSQNVRVYREGWRWVTEPEKGFEVREVEDGPMLWGCRDMPARVYTAETDDFRLTIHYQKTLVVNNRPEPQTNGPFPNLSGTFSTQLKTDSDFDEARYNHWMTLTYLGNPEDKKTIHNLGVSSIPWDEGEERPELRSPGSNDGGGSSTDLSAWDSVSLRGDTWDNEIWMGGGGTSAPFEKDDLYTPDRYAANLYVNGRKVAELTLLPEEEIK